MRLGIGARLAQDLPAPGGAHPAALEGLSDGGKASELESKDLSRTLFTHMLVCPSSRLGLSRARVRSVGGNSPIFRSSSLCCVSRLSGKKQRLTVVIPKNECGGFCGPSISVNSPQYSEPSVPSNSWAPM